MLKKFGPAQMSQFLVLTKRSVASGDENGFVIEPFSFPEAALLLVSTKNRDLWFDPIL